MMTLLVPETQVASPFTGTFVVDDGLGNLSPFTNLAGAPRMGLDDGGEMMLMASHLISRPPLAWGGSGTVAKDYTADLAAGVYEDVTGAFLRATLTEKRDYVILLTFAWQWNSGNNCYQLFRIRANGSETGIFPAYYYKFRPTTPSGAERELSGGIFYLKNWEPGTYLIQLQHSPWGSNQNRYVLKSQLVMF